LDLSPRTAFCENFTGGNGDSVVPQKIKGIMRLEKIINGLERGDATKTEHLFDMLGVLEYVHKFAIGCPRFVGVQDLCMAKESADKQSPRPSILYSPCVSVLARKSI
jgi:hypothetical protein